MAAAAGTAGITRVLKAVGAAGFVVRRALIARSRAERFTAEGAGIAERK
jgi:hypothetical protein